MDLFNNPHTKQAEKEQETINRIIEYKANILSHPDFGIVEKHSKIPSIHRYTEWCLTNLRKKQCNNFLNSLESINKIVKLARL